MEHVVNPEVIERFSLMVDYARQHPVPVGDWLRQFHQYACPRVRTRIKRAERLSQSAAKIPFTLDQLKPGQKAAIVKITAAGTLGRRLAEMGMVRGAPVEVVKVAPLGGPIEVRVKGYSLSLRKNEAAAIAIDLS